MEKNPSSAEELRTIRQYMEESTRFLSLSGLSGVFPGIFAIAGAIIAHFLILDNGTLYDEYFNNPTGSGTPIRHLMAIDAIAVLILSLTMAFYFSLNKAKRSGKSFWTPVSKRLIVNLFIPLITGGIFAIILVVQNNYELIIPAFLVFYGLGLINAGKFTYNEIFYLGVLEIITGLLSAFFPQQGLIFWTVGFGVLHIFYGLFMYRKYEA